jgi:hypothetical protein
VNLHGPLGSHVLRGGARVTLTFTLPRHIGRVLRFRMHSSGAPDVGFFCKPPGKKVRDC